MAVVAFCRFYDMRRKLSVKSLYAVSQVVGVSALYLGVVSDCVEGPAWEDGFSRIRASMGDLQDLIVTTVAHVPSRSELHGTTNYDSDGHV